MGAYLFYRVEDKSLSTKVDDILEALPEYKVLKELSMAPSIKCDKDIEWAKKNNPSLLSYFEDGYGTGEYKTSGLDIEILEKAGLSEEYFFELLATIFEKAQKIAQDKLGTCIQFLGRSCSFNSGYFTKMQIKRMTSDFKHMTDRANFSFCPI